MVDVAVYLRWCSSLLRKDRTTFVLLSESVFALIYPMKLYLGVTNTTQWVLIQTNRCNAESGMMSNQIKSNLIGHIHMVSRC